MLDTGFFAWFLGQLAHTFDELEAFVIADIAGITISALDMGIATAFIGFLIATVFPASDEEDD